MVAGARKRWHAILSAEGANYTSFFANAISRPSA
jgi:hypothetical protein